MDAFTDLANTTERIDTAQLAKALDTLSATFKNTPEEVQASLTGLSRLSRNVAKRDEQLKLLLQHSNVVTKVLADRNQQLIKLMKDGNTVFQAVQARRALIHQLLVSTQKLSAQITALVRENRKDLAPTLTKVNAVLAVLLKNQNDLDASIKGLAPFVRVFTNTLGTGPWFDIYVQNLAPGPGDPAAEGRRYPGCRRSWEVAADAELASVSRLIAIAVVLVILAVSVVTLWPKPDAGHGDGVLPARGRRCTRAPTSGSSGSRSARWRASPRPAGRVRVKFWWEAKHKVPANAKAVIASPSIVADRYIQLTPAYSKGDVMADGAEIPLDADRRTAGAGPDLPEPERPVGRARPEGRERPGRAVPAAGRLGEEPERPGREAEPDHHRRVEADRHAGGQLAEPVQHDPAAADVRVRAGRERRSWSGSSTPTSPPPRPRWPVSARTWRRRCRCWRPRSARSRRSSRTTGRW